MEVKIYWKSEDGVVRIDSHQIPQYVGDVATQTDEKALRDTTENENDKIADIVERVVVGNRGVYLERYKRIIAPDDQFVKRGTFITNGSKGNCLVASKDMKNVTRVTVDDEQVWPEVEVGDPADELEHIVGALREIVG